MNIMSKPQKRTAEEVEHAIMDDCTQQIQKILKPYSHDLSMNILLCMILAEAKSSNVGLDDMLEAIKIAWEHVEEELKARDAAAK
jgi:transcriptional/translational regulatory protein YebC/TACO1